MILRKKWLHALRFELGLIKLVTRVLRKKNFNQLKGAVVRSEWGVRELNK